MARWRIEYYPERRFSPVSWWVHRHREPDEWRQAQVYQPPFPEKDASKGFPYLLIQINGYELEFASSNEVYHCINILQQRHLPNTKDLVCPQSTTYQGFNHWLATYPAKLKPWRKRQQTIKVLENTLKELMQSGYNF